MRSREQFKAYVYEKADAARASNRRMHSAWIRGAVAFSLLVVVGSAFAFGNTGWSVNDILSPAAEKSANMEAFAYRGDAETAAPMQNYSVVFEDTSVADITDGTDALIKGYGEMTSEESIQYSATVETQSAWQSQAWTLAKTADAYSGELKNIDFSKNAALVITSFKTITGWDVSYGEDTVTVTLYRTSEEANAQSYTVLLDKAKLLEKTIEIVYK